jgi:CheY-like chemotaxis protein
MGGRIWVESGIGGGSIFRFTVRLRKERRSEPRIPTGPQVTLKELHDLPVLVVDDHPTNRLILEEVLEHWGLRPRCVANAPEAIATLEAAAADGAPYPLVLVDAQMPDVDGFMLAERIKSDPGLAGATIMMLSSSAQLGDAVRCRELGIERYLTKPVKQSELLGAMLGVLTPAAVTPRRVRPGRGPAAPAARPLRILLAEDNIVNQRLATKLLEKLGHTVVVADNGRLALQALDREAFDVVLMDVQMPEMSGIEATAAIREREQQTGAHQPIIAMTAHAMSRDRDRFLAAGMDGYVPKPIRPQDLFAAIDAVVAPRSGDAPVGLPAAAPREPAIRRDQLLAAFDGNEELLSEIAELFAQDGPRLLTAIRAALTRNDAAALQRAAHELKGSVANFGQSQARVLAERLERMGRDGTLAGAAPLCEELDGALAQVRQALAQ